jgi:hypothetical protein
MYSLYHARLVFCLTLASCTQSPGSSATDMQDAVQHTANEQGIVVRGEILHPWCRGEPVRDIVLTADSLGPVTAATNRTRLHTVCPTSRDTTVVDAEGHELQATLLYFGSQKIGWVEWSPDQRLELVRVLSPVVKTPAGLRVGSRMHDVRSAIGALSAGYDDAGVYVWDDSERRLSYLISVPQIFDLLPSPDDVAERPEVIPDSATIIALLLDPVG